MRRPLKTGLLALSCLTLLQACQSRQLVTQYETLKVEVPPTLTDCQIAPEKPEGAYTQRAVARYIVRLHAAHSECRGRLRVLNIYIGDTNAQE